jgi:hypothetical protein
MGGIHTMQLRDLAPRSNGSPEWGWAAAYEQIERESFGGSFVNSHNLRLVGNISGISQPGFYEDYQERVTVSVEGAEPLYAELRLPNRAGWVVGQKVLVVIIPAPPEDGGAH